MFGISQGSAKQNIYGLQGRLANLITRIAQFQQDEAKLDQENQSSKLDYLMGIDRDVTMAFDAISFEAFSKIKLCQELKAIVSASAPAGQEKLAEFMANMDLRYLSLFHSQVASSLSLRQDQTATTCPAEVHKIPEVGMPAVSQVTSTSQAGPIPESKIARPYFDMDGKLCHVPSARLKLVQDFWSWLSSLMVNYYLDNRIPPQNSQKINAWLQHLQTSLRAELSQPKLYVKLFGSSANGFGRLDSDVDVCIMGIREEAKFNNELRSRYLHKIVPWVNKNYGVIRVEMHDDWPKPVLRYRDELEGFEVDVTIQNSLAVENTRLLLEYSRFYEDGRVAQLVFAVRYLLRDILEFAGLSSYGLAILCIFYLQKLGILPCLQQDGEIEDKKSTRCGHRNVEYCVRNLHKLKTNSGKEHLQVGQLLEHFCAYFSEFNPEDELIQIHTRNNLKRSDIPRHNKNVRKGYFVIIDPFELERNLGNKVTRTGFARIKDFFGRLSTCLENRANRFKADAKPFIQATGEAQDFTSLMKSMNEHIADELSLP